MNYRDAWQFLDNLQFFKIKLGLDSMTTFMRRLGSPESRLSCVHIAGTNGKGSVAATIRAVLARAGYSVGVYTSPHLSSVRERFRINDDWISQDDFARLSKVIVDALHGEQITYFEFTTALAFLWFAERDVDCAIIETGLGGRLDATNIVRPRVSVITNIAMDHEAYLGTTLAAIAFEKAGIIKDGVPVVSGMLGAEAAEVIARTAQQKGAPLFLLDRDFSFSAAKDTTLTYEGMRQTIPGLALALKGGYQAGNAALALAAIEVWLGNEARLDSGAVREGLSAVRWPGRLEYFAALSWQGRSCPVLFDGAHNPAGVDSLCEALQSDFEYDKLIMVWASMGDKDFQVCVRHVAPICARIIFTRPESVRSATPDQLVESLPPAERDKCQGAATVAEALTLAFSLAGPADLICVAGSLYLIGKARGLLVGDLVAD